MTKSKQEKNDFSYKKRIQISITCERYDRCCTVMGRKGLRKKEKKKTFLQKELHIM
jgi:hypothetical protein